MPKKVTIDNPFFNEFVYDILQKATWEQKRRLPGNMYKVITNERSARIWIKRSSIEEKDVVLALLGIKYFKIYANSEASSLKELKDILASYGLNKRVSGLNDLIRQNFFVYSDKEVISLFSLMAAGCHSLTYLLNRDYAKTSYGFLKWQKDADLATDTEIKEAIEGAKMIATFSLKAMLIGSYFPNGLGLTENEFKVLVYFYPKKHTYVPRGTIHDDFNGYLSTIKVTTALRKLWEAKYLEREADKKTNYSITARGIKAVHDYMNAIFHAMNF